MKAKYEPLMGFKNKQLTIFWNGEITNQNEEIEMPEYLKLDQMIDASSMPLNNNHKDTNENTSMFAESVIIIPDECFDIVNPNLQPPLIVCRHFMLGLPDGTIVEIDEEDEKAILFHGIEGLNLNDGDGKINRGIKMSDEDFKSYVDEVKKAVDIVDIIGNRIHLNNCHMAICPFHNDDNPSLSVNSDRQYFYCFGCCVGGDVFTFLMLYENMTFTEALNMLAEYAGIKASKTFQRR